MVAGPALTYSAVPEVRIRPDRSGSGSAREASRKESGVSKARRLSILIGAFLLALSITLTGCGGGADKEEQKKEVEKKEEQDKEKKEETQ